MKRMKMIAVTLFAAAGSCGSMALAVDKVPTGMTQNPPSVEHGKSLFYDPALSGSPNDKSCNTCHPGGKGLGNAWKNPKLAETINTCITSPLMGKALTIDSKEMKSLMLYIKSLKSTSSGY